MTKEITLQEACDEINRLNRERDALKAQLSGADEMVKVSERQRAEHVAALRNAEIATRHQRDKATAEVDALKAQLAAGAVCFDDVQKFLKALSTDCVNEGLEKIVALKAKLEAAERDGQWWEKQCTQAVFLMEEANRRIEKALPIIEAEADRRDYAPVEDGDGISGYSTEMRELADDLRNAEIATRHQRDKATAEVNPLKAQLAEAEAKAERMERGYHEVQAEIDRILKDSIEDGDELRAKLAAAEARADAAEKKIANYARLWRGMTEIEAKHLAAMLTAESAAQRMREQVLAIVAQQSNGCQISACREALQEIARAAIGEGKSAPDCDHPFRVTGESCGNCGAQEGGGE